MVREAARGSYDALVLGRRGYAALSGLFSGSVTSDVLEQPLACPVWICRKPAEGPRNVLLCVDGSPASLRMADHVGFMLQRESHRVCLFHVMNDEGVSTRSGSWTSRSGFLKKTGWRRSASTGN